MRRLVSPFILDRLTDADHTGSLEAASLFVDTAGFTAMVGALTEHGRYGAEVAAQVMSTLWAPLVEAVYAQGGVITGFAGDAFTAMFPSGGAVVDRSCLLRALAAAHAMRQQGLTRSRYDTPWGAFDVGVKIGLAAGTVEWSILRQPDHSRAAFYVRGSAIDGCAATDLYNQPGELVLHPSCRPLLGDVVTMAELDDGYAGVASLTGALPDPQAVQLPPVTAEALMAFVPREIVEQTEVGEYRHVVNVFINVMGDPDDAALRRMTGLIWDLQATYGGHFNRIDFGDKGCNLLLHWGAPVGFENDVDRALGFLLDLRRDTPTPLRVGVTSGVSHAGFVGSDLHAEFTCSGRGVNLAARLMSAAPWGSIWMDAEVRRRASERFVTHLIGEWSFKGFAEVQKVFEVSDRRDAGERRFGGDMIGRSAELQALTAFVEPVHAGGFAGALVVRGEPGMGKSRLISAFLESVDAAVPSADGQRPRLRALAAPADSIARTPFNPFRQLLRNYFAYNPRAPERDNKAAFDQRFDALLDDLPDAALRRDLQRARSALGALVDLHWDGSPFAHLDPAGRYETTLDGVANLIRAESLRQPVVLVMEDIHWIDDASAEVVRRLVLAAAGTSSRSAARGGRSALAVLATARPLEASPFGDEIGLRYVALGPLARSELAMLVTHVLGGGPPSSDLVDLLEVRADGNPFFAEQLVHFLHDEHMLRRVDGEWLVDRAAMSDAVLPTDIALICVAQLDRLGRTTLEVVQAASVLGREFDQLELLEMMNEAGMSPPALGPAIDAGQAAGIWHRVSPSRHTFRHVLLRDAAYDMQIRARRAQMHHRAGLALERLWADDRQPHYGDISRHFESAFLLGVEAAREPAADYLAKAGIQAATAFASAAAADLLSRALALIPDDDATGRFQLLLEREGANDLHGDRAAQVADVDELESLAASLDDAGLMAEAAIRRSYVTSDLADFAGALAASDRTLLLARQAGLPGLESTALRTAGAALRALGRFDEARERMAQAITVARSAELDYQEATAWTAWSSLSARQGQWREAVSALERVVPTFERLGRTARVAQTFAELGLAFLAGGRLAEAEARFERALSLTRDVGDRAGQIPPLSSLAQVMAHRGDFAGADAAAAEAVDIADQIGHAHLGTHARAIRGRVALLRGDREAAGRWLAESERLAHERFPDLLSTISTHRAALALLDDQPFEALALGSTALDLALAVDDHVDVTMARLYRGLTYEALGRRAAAATDFRAVIALESAIDATPGRTWDCRAGLARMALADGDLNNALDEVTPIVEHVAGWRCSAAAGHGLSQCEQPRRVYQTAAQVLSAAGDHRADEMRVSWW